MSEEVWLRLFRTLASNQAKFNLKSIKNIQRRHVDRSEGLAARGYFIPGGASQRGVVGVRRSVSHVVRHGQGLASGWVPLGPVRARRGSSGVRMGPYLSRTPIRVHRVFRQGSSGTIGPYRLMLGFRPVSVRTPIWHDRTRQASTDHSIVPYGCTTKIRTSWSPVAAPRAFWGPVDTRRGPGSRPGAPWDPIS